MEDMRSQISQKTNIKNQPMKLFPRHLASNLHIGMSRDLTTAILKPGSYGYYAGHNCVRFIVHGWSRR